MNRIIPAAAFLAMASAAANAAWGLKFEVSKDDGVTWTTNMMASTGDTITFRMGSYFDVGTPVTTVDGTGAAAEMNRFTGSNEWANFANGSDVISDVVRSVPSGSQVIVSVSGNTIGTTSPASFGGNLILGSLPAEPVTYTEILRGRLKIGVGTVRSLIWQNKTFGTDTVKGLTFFNYGSPTNKLSGQPDGDRTDIVAEVFIPAPSAMALLGFGTFVVARRRRAE